MGLIQKLKTALGQGAPATEHTAEETSGANPEPESPTIYRCQRCREEYTENQTLCDKCGGSVQKVMA
jgi:predicted RNA-binding Zn-ribbon protein involved in translation (DUF1610 family)